MAQQGCSRCGEPVQKAMRQCMNCGQKIEDIWEEYGSGSSSGEDNETSVREEAPTLTQDLEAIEISHQSELDDSLAQRGCRVLQENGSISVLKYGSKYSLSSAPAADHNAKGPSMAVWSRSDDSNMTALDIGRTHLENIIVGLDWQATRQQEELQDSSLPRTPLATSITSFIGTQAAGHPKPMWHKSPNSTAETQWIQFLERAHAEGQEVTVVVRGICGYSVWPDSFGSILGRFGGGSNPLVVRLGFALRRNFVAYANCCLPPGDHPFLLPKNVTVNARGFHHTALVNIRALHDEYNARIVDPLAHRLNRWFWEEAAARNGHGGMDAEVALRVKNIRSHDRNRIVAG